MKCIDLDLRFMSLIIRVMSVDLATLGRTRTPFLSLEQESQKIVAALDELLTH